MLCDPGFFTLFAFLWSIKKADSETSKGNRSKGSMEADIKVSNLLLLIAKLS